MVLLSYAISRLKVLLVNIGLKLFKPPHTEYKYNAYVWLFAENIGKSVGYVIEILGKYFFDNNIPLYPKWVESHWLSTDPCFVKPLDVLPALLNGCVDRQFQGFYVILLSVFNRRC